MARRHVLIGAGPAAISAARAIRSQDSSAEIHLVSADPHGYYSRPGLAYFLLNHVPADLLFPFKPGELAKQGITILHDRADGIDLAAKSVTLASGKVLAYDRLLIASGSSSIPLAVPGADLDGIVKLDDMDDARNVIARCRQASAAVVIGGGTTAVEIAEGLRTQRVRVHYLMAGERYWSDVLSPAESRIVERRLAARRIQLHPYTRIARIIGQNGKVSAVETEDGTRISCDMVAVSIGVLPRKQLPASAGIICGRGVLVDQFMRTSDPSVYAAGDIAEVDSDRSGAGTLEVLWNSAVNQGRVAGLNMAAEPVHRYTDDVALNVTRIAGLKCMIIGTVGSGSKSDLVDLARGDSDIWRHAEDASVMEFESDHVHIRLLLAGSRIVGAVVIGDQRLAFPLQELISARADVSPIVARLNEREPSIADLLEGYLREWKAAHV
jgi:NAD(P)H-nitrite reductase large subunit